jgi:hypothetical protein
MINRQFWDINDIKRHYSGHWFSPDSMRFFRSRLCRDVWEGPGGVFFVSSECGPSPDSVRKWTVRAYDPVKRSISTVGDFNAIRSMCIAKRIARRLSLGLQAYENARG